ncbi:MAG: hypothetical protein ACLP5V_02055 [Candidatus Bathyarchaeia archaeon]
MTEEMLKSVHEKQILSYARNHFSPYIYVSEIDEKSSEARLGLIIQDGIIDHETDEFRMRTVNLGNVGSLSWQRSPRGKIRFHGSTRTQLIKNTNNLYSTIINKSQQLLLTSLYEKLVTIDTVSVAMKPFKRILVSLEQSDRKTISLRDLGRRLSDKRRQRAPQYLNVLKELRYIERVDDGKYTIGEAMSNLKADSIESTRLYSMILADVIRQRSRYLQQVLHLTMIVPFLRWSNSYYFPSYEAGRLVKMHNKELFANCRRYYGVRTDEDSANSQLQSMVEKDLLTRDLNGNYRGIDSTFKEYSANADKDGILAPI